MMDALGIKSKRVRYTNAQTLLALRLCTQLGGSIRRTVSVLRARSGWAQMSRRVLRGWVVKAQTSTAAPPRAAGGRPVNVAFEDEVMQRLMFTTLKDGLAEVQASAAYTYDNIRMAAVSTAKEDAWKDDAKVKKLKFTNKWVKSFLDRRRLVRRKVTAQQKVRPSVADVQARLATIQKVCLQAHMPAAMCVACVLGKRPDADVCVLACVRARAHAQP
jgi:hypothetical protein